MAFVITSDCIKCGVCADVCPENAIVEDETQYIIIEICIDCGICLPECPIEAIKGKTK
ncbi:MAG: 4Fe-4S binding protein [Candidatus Cloacimonetes bacterium]|nr:4Fe-4S binding protein [Candidatus Cloacimonadota bacterium]MBL7107690.1 4Fe-4S binding protein [Candidatus Cloacimonadota bacterium]